MELVNLIILIVICVLVLGILLYLYLSSAKKREAKKKVESVEVKERVKVPSFAKLAETIKLSASTNEQLHEAVDLILKHYPKIKPKNGTSPSKDFKRYADVIFSVTTHPNTDKELVLKLDRELSKHNPSYRREIDEMLNRGLSARG
jgi:hypothetical protein